MKPKFSYVSIGNGIYARVKRAPLSLIEQYREKQAACSHQKRDPRGTCYECGHKAERVGQ
jgi:hypothetical protein